MTRLERIRIYEQRPLLDVAGETIRPGGRALTDHALTFCELSVGARVLDVGCGLGASVEHLTTHYQFAAFGIDLSALLLRAAHQRNQTLPLIHGQGERLPIGANQCAAVIAECSLSVLASPEQMLTECWRVLQKGGYLILTDVYARDATGAAALLSLPIASCLRGALPQTTIIHQVENAGFAVHVWEDHTAALKSFAARLIWAHGSMHQFWCRAAAQANPDQIEAVVAQARPGYYLLIAQKNTG